MKETRCRALEHRQGDRTLGLGVWSKKALQAWNGTRMYQSFFRADPEDKDFQVALLLCFVFLGLSIKAL